MNQQQSNWIDDGKAAVGWIMFICQSLAASVEVFLHQGIGARYLGMQSAAAGLMIFLYLAWWPGYDPNPTLWYLFFYFLFCFAHRMDAIKAQRRGGPQQHSRYTGRPIIMRWTRGRFSEITVKRVIEPFVVLVTGFLLLDVSEPLGCYLLLASGGLLASVQLSMGHDYTRAMNMNDAALESRQVAESFRDMHGHHS